MRLNPREIQATLQTTAECFRPDARVWLFDSRVDDEICDSDGDIDLFVETTQSLENRLDASLGMNAKLILRLGEQKIDVIFVDPATPMQPIHQIAKNHGILL